MTLDRSRLAQAFAAIDAANAQDPKTVIVGAQEVPANLAYGQRMTAELTTFSPGASEPLQIAARGQHIERWAIPRASYPMDRSGYHRWRLALRDHHAARLTVLLKQLGYEQETIDRVAAIVRKERLRDDPEVQTLEDVICIVFMKYELADFIGRYAGDEAKLAGILAKTWRKMSERGQQAVLALPPSPAVLALLQKGLESPGS